MLNIISVGNVRFITYLQPKGNYSMNRFGSEIHHNKTSQNYTKYSYKKYLLVFGNQRYSRQALV